jgi:hypothetical protein
MNKTILALLSSFVLVPGATIAQEANDYHKTFGDHRVGDHIGTLMTSVKAESSVSDTLWGEISRDPKAMCKQVGLGSNTSSSDRSSSNVDKGTLATGSNTSGGGGLDLGFIRAGGSGGSVNSRNQSWDRSGSSTQKASFSTVAIGTDCSELIKAGASMETNRMDNDTQRLGILVNNETQRYGIDKQHQVAIKQIEAGQIQTVFGGGAKAMMGDMAR